jgi:DNA polymerase/3'-5' exonuclease PolX
MTTTVAERQRVPLGQARPIAEELVAVMAPFCERVAIAGSIRREKADIGDIEIVAVPVIRYRHADLFGDVLTEIDTLHEEVAVWRENGFVWDRLDKNGRSAFGAKFKRLVYRCALGEMPLDLFSTTRDQFGAIFAIRTGCAQFSKRLVTSVLEGGCMPIGMKQRDGSLWDGGREIPTPEEDDFFRALGRETLPPAARTEHAVPRRLMRSGR